MNMRSFLCLALGSLLAAQTTNPASAQDHHLEVIARLTPGAVVMPSEISPCTPGQLEWCTPEVLAALTAWGTESIELAFPTFVKADTLAIAARTGEMVRVTDRSDIYIFRVSSETTVDSLIAELTGAPGVVYAERNIVEVTADDCRIMPTDNRFPEQWALDDANDNDIDAPEGWCITTGTSVRVGIMDRGVDFGHPELVGRVTGEVGFDGYHGTHVAGIVAAMMNNGGIVGVNPAAWIDSRRIINDPPVSADQIADRIEMSVNVGSDVLNFSVRFVEPQLSNTTRFAFADAYKRNVVLVASMGNQNTTAVQYPAGYGQGIIAVGATDITGDRWVRPDGLQGSNMGAHIDVVAPGAQVLSSVPGEHDPTGYAIDTGTSMSAAYVSGIASMLLSFDQTLYNDDVEQLIRLSAKDRGPAGWDQQYGTGIVSLRNALALLDSPYTLLHRSASGGTPLGPVPIAGQVIYDVPGLASYPHPADRYEVRRAVAFSSLYAIPPSVWGRGVATTGFNSDGLNFAVGFAEPVPGSISKTGCTLRTYVYEMFTIPDHSSLGYFPCAPGNVNLAYTVHGIEDHLAPTSTVGAPNGGETVQAGQSATIEWEVTDEYLQGVECTILLDLDTAGGTIVWQVAEGLGVDESGNGSYSWSIPGGQPGDDSYRIRVIAYDTNNHQGVDVSDAYFTINPWSGKGGPPPPPDPCEAPCMPVSWTPNFVTDLLPVSPNPFNPQTRLRFTLAGPDEISLRVYDVHGRLVATVVDGVRQQGLHEIPWNGRDSAGRPLPSGVYFAALNADRRVFTQKIVILK